MNHPFSLQGKTILITGASSGIGKATAVLCAQMGAKLIIVGRNSERLNAVFNSLQGQEHQQIVLDFEKENAVEELILKIEKLDGIVHSAGISLNLPFKFTNLEKLTKIMRVNFEIPFMITQKLLKNKQINKESSIVFLSSVSGYNAVAKGITAYSASKGAISASIRVMALELAPQKIRVNAVCPGMVQTEMNTENSHLTAEQLKADELLNYPLGYGKPEDVANSIVFLLSEGSSWITGSNLVIDGGASIH